MPISCAAPTFASPHRMQDRRQRVGQSSRRWLAALVGATALLLPAAPASAAELLTNGGFESGTFSGWTTTELSQPYTPWVIATAGTSGGRGAATPQEGTYDAMNGFDGNGPGHFTLSQTVAIPAGTTVLSWKDRIQYAVFGSAARLLEVKLLDPNTDVVLATLYTFTTGVNTSSDTGWQSHSVDLSAFGGQTVKLVFDETIPENFTGPAQIEFDAISVLVVTVALSGTGTQVDADGDGISDSVDTDDDGDGSADSADSFPLDRAESVDTDGDGIGDNADSDDDGDGAPDSADAFPLDPGRQAAPKPTLPGVAQPWTLQIRARPSVSQRTTGLLVSTGLAAACPAGGPACSGRLTLKVLRRSSATGKLRRLFLTGKVKVTTVAAGTERRITFRLNRPGSRLLRELGSFKATLRGVVAAGRNRPIVRTATLRISAPR